MLDNKCRRDNDEQNTVLAPKELTFYILPFFYHRLSTEKYGLMVKCSDYVVKQTWIQVHGIGQAIFASVGLPFSICDVGIRQNMQLKVFTMPVA